MCRAIHVTGKAFAGGKGFRGLCRLPAAKQTGKTANENGEICPLNRHKLCNFADNKVMKVKKNDLVKKISCHVYFDTHFNF